MRILQKVKDGGPESPVDAFVLIEIKCLFSIILLKFNSGSRGAYHSHAFNAVTWWLKGHVTEESVIELKLGNPYVDLKRFDPSWKPKFTPRTLFHKIFNFTDTPVWALTFRGPWKKTWKEFHMGRVTTFTHGRKIIEDRLWDNSIDG